MPLPMLMVTLSTAVSTWIHISLGDVLNYRRPKLFQWCLVIMAMLLVSIAFREKHFSAVNFFPLTLQAALEMTVHFMFLTYFRLFCFLAFKLVEVSNSHSCSFTFLISTSEYMLFL